MRIKVKSVRLPDLEPRWKCDCALEKYSIRSEKETRKRLAIKITDGKRTLRHRHVHASGAYAERNEREERVSRLTESHSHSLASHPADP